MVLTLHTLQRIFLNAIKANMVITAGPEQVGSPYHESWIFKRIANIQTTRIGPAQQWFSHLTLEIKKNFKRFAEYFGRTFNQ